MEQRLQKTPLYLNIIRVLVGVLFIFSGLIKANDPSGLAFKMQEFFDKWGVSGLNQFAMFFSITIIAFEIIAGVALLLGYAFRFFSLLLLLLMIFFTALTGYAVWYEMSTGNELKCGCFGDCIPLTANQSFGKDIVLLILSIILLINWRRIKPLFSSTINTVIMMIALAFSLLVQWYMLRNLPMVDCLPYKPGNNLWLMKEQAKNNTGDVYETNFTVMVDGKERVYPYHEYMADSNSHIWELEVIKQEDKLIKKGAVNPISDFAILDETGSDLTEDLLTDDGYYFAWIIRAVDQDAKTNIDRIKNIYKKSLEGETVGVIAVTSADRAAVRKLLADNGLADVEIFIMDGTVAKTVMRANSGLILFNKGKILGKWSPTNYPKGFSLDKDRIELIK